MSNINLREKKSPLYFFTQLDIQLLLFSYRNCISSANLLAPALFGGSAFSKQAALKNYRAEPIWFDCCHRQLVHPASSEEVSCPLATVDIVQTSTSAVVRGSLRLYHGRGQRAIHGQFGSFKNSHIETAGESLLSGAPHPPFIQPPGWFWETQCDHRSLMHWPKLLGSFQKQCNMFGFSLQLPKHSWLFQLNCIS